MEDTTIKCRTVLIDSKIVVKPRGKVWLIGGRLQEVAIEFLAVDKDPTLRTATTCLKNKIDGEVTREWVLSPNRLSAPLLQTILLWTKWNKIRKMQKFSFWNLKIRMGLLVRLLGANSQLTSNSWMKFMRKRLPDTSIKSNFSNGLYHCLPKTRPLSNSVSKKISNKLIIKAVSFSLKGFLRRSTQKRELLKASQLLQNLDNRNKSWLTMRRNNNMGFHSPRSNNCVRPPKKSWLIVWKWIY